MKKMVIFFGNDGWWLHGGTPVSVAELVYNHLLVTSRLEFMNVYGDNNYNIL